MRTEQKRNTQYSNSNAYTNDACANGTDANNSGEKCVQTIFASYAHCLSRCLKLKFVNCTYKIALVTTLLVLEMGAANASSLPEPLTAEDFPVQNEKQAKLGQLLFYDKILSGNKNISCGTCHHLKHGGADGLSLGIGEGGSGLGPDRLPGTSESRIKRRIPRNAPALWNLGANDIEILFHDGRLSLSDDYGNGFNSPAEERLPEGLSGLLAAQALFPMAARFEMAGDPEENSVARAAFDRIDHVWPIITKRIKGIPDYVALFVDAFDHIESERDIRIVDIANAIAAFETLEWQSTNSRFDQFVSGRNDALSESEKTGMNLFYGQANCSECHSGKLFTDQKFYALGLPPFGPGRTRRHDPMPRDVGRLGESDRREDAYRFRTPSLRNVEFTAPYGHNGAYRSLKAMVEHHLNPAASRNSWKPNDAAIPDIAWLNEADFLIQQDKREMQRYQARQDIQPVELDKDQVQAIVEFLKTLSSPDVTQTAFGVPDQVPSGLPVDK